MEIMLSIALLTVIAGMGLPFYHNLQTRTTQDNAAFRLTQMSRRAQDLSQGIKTDAAWGIYIGDQYITLFRGTDYSTRDPDYDETYKIPAEINFTGDQEYVYSKLDGRLPSSVSIGVEAPEEETMDININQAGMIEY